MSKEFPTLREAMIHKADGYGWRSMDCAPRRTDDCDPFETPETIVVRTEHDEDITVVWAIEKEQSPAGWRRADKSTAPINGRLIAWRPVIILSEPDERTKARSLAFSYAAEAAKVERMAKFLPQEADRAARLRAEEKRYLEIAQKRR